MLRSEKNFLIQTAAVLQKDCGAFFLEVPY